MSGTSDAAVCVVAGAALGCVSLGVDPEPRQLDGFTQLLASAAAGLSASLPGFRGLPFAVLSLPLAHWAETKYKGLKYYAGSWTEGADIDAVLAGFTIWAAAKLAKACFGRLLR